MSSCRRTATLGLILAAAIVFIISLPVQASDPLAGTWELNLAKSKYRPGPPPQSETRTYEVIGQQEKMITKGISSQQRPTHFQVTANRDGKDYTYEGWPRADTISLTHVDPFTATWTMKKAGEVVVTGTRVISKDGKMMTISVKSPEGKGPSVENIQVFDKR
jgi:hypothetical protein